MRDLTRLALTLAAPRRYGAVDSRANQVPAVTRVGLLVAITPLLVTLLVGDAVQRQPSWLRAVVVVLVPIAAAGAWIGGVVPFWIFLVALYPSAATIVARALNRS